MKTAIILLCAAALSCAAQGKGKGKGNRKDGAPAAASSVAVVFDAGDSRVISDWVRTTGPSGLPPGLAKKGELPPGLQKQLRRGGTLPPGLRKKLSPFPPELNSRLRPLPADCGCERVFLDGKAMIVARAAGAVLDAITVLRDGR